MDLSKVPQSTGLYWASVHWFGVWDSIIHVTGESPFLSVRVIDIPVLEGTKGRKSRAVVRDMEVGPPVVKPLCWAVKGAKSPEYKMENTQSGASISGREPDGDVARGEGWTDTASLKAGPELDRSVAEAAEITLRAPTISELKSVLSGEHESRDHLGPAEFKPSTDLNAAFLAANKFGLWKTCHLKPGPRRSFFVMHERVSGEARFYIHGPTAALAICAAILKMKRERDEAGRV